jgi:hypothetical protein
LCKSEDGDQQKELTGDDLLADIDHNFDKDLIGKIEDIIANVD